MAETGGIIGTIRDILKRSGPEQKTRKIAEEVVDQFLAAETQVSQKSIYPTGGATIDFREMRNTTILRIKHDRRFSYGKTLYAWFVVVNTKETGGKPTIFNIYGESKPGYSGFSDQLRLTTKKLSPVQGELNQPIEVGRLLEVFARMPSDLSMEDYIAKIHRVDIMLFGTTEKSDKKHPSSKPVLKEAWTRQSRV